MKSVCVLLATFNGERYLPDQIESLMEQKGVSIKIFVRDDGSTDNTHKLLKKWSKKGILTWYTGENLKPANSFMSLLKEAPIADYYAFCDQDDIWDKDKLDVAVKEMNKYDESNGILYCCGSRLVDSNLNYICDHKMDVNR